MQTGMSLLGQLDWLTLVLVALAAFCTALFHSVAGFAGALLLSVCLAPLIGVKAVVPVVAFAMIISNTNRVFLFRKHINWPAYRAIMITGLPGIVFGAAVYLFLSVKMIAIVLGGFGIVAALGLTLNITKSIVFGAGQLLDQQLMSLGLVVGLCTIPGGMLGKWITKRSRVEVHTLVVETLMFAGGCYFLYQGFYMH